MGCNWTCTGCWSAYGQQGLLQHLPPAGEPLPEDGAGPRYELAPAQVIDKLLAGMKRNAQSMCRISGGEITLWWDHMIALIDEFLDRTTVNGRHIVMDMEGVTDPEGDPVGIILETNGSLLTPDRLEFMEDRWGAQAGRVMFSIGFKATHPEALQALTGHSAKTAVRAHEAQLTALMHLAVNCKHLAFWASFLDAYTDPSIYAGMQREVERARPGHGRQFAIQPMKRYGNANRFWTPKRFRGSERALNDPSPAKDDEIITQFLDLEGDSVAEHLEYIEDLSRRAATETDPDKKEDLEAELREALLSTPSDEPVDVEPIERGKDPLVDLQLDFADHVEAQDLPEGRLVADE